MQILVIRKGLLNLAYMQVSLIEIFQQKVPLRFVNYVFSQESISL